MAVVNVACPNCGKEARATLNSRDDKIINLTTSSSGMARGTRNYTSKCSSCGGKFYYDLK